MMSQKASSDPCSPVVRASCAISSWVSSRPRCLGPLAEGPEPVGVGVAEIGASLASGVVGAGTEGAPFRFLVTVLVLEELEEEKEGGVCFGVLLGGLLLRLFAFDFGFVVTCGRSFGLELVPRGRSLASSPRAPRVGTPLLRSLFCRVLHERFEDAPGGSSWLSRRLQEELSGRCSLGCTPMYTPM